MFVAAFAAGVFDQNSPHRLGSGGEKVTAAVPVLNLFDIDQAQIGFVHECRRLKRLTGVFVVQTVSRELAQFFVEKGQKLFGRAGIAGFNLR